MSNRSNSLIKNDLANNHGKRYMAEITLSLFVLGGALRTSVDICNVNPICGFNGVHDVSINNLKIFHLKKLIWNNIKENEENVNKSIHLKLWKVEIPRDDKQLDKFNEMFHDGKDIENQLNQLGKALHQDDHYKEWFPSNYQPPSKTVHIIVQPPPLPTTTEHIKKKRRLWYRDPKETDIIQGLSDTFQQVPVSQSEFRLVRENHLLYVDKTNWLSKLNLNCGYYFVSRPRKFGKSMFLSMIESFFLVQHNLFKNLYIFRHPPDIYVRDTVKKWNESDLTPIPVIRLDFSKLTSNEGPEALKRGLIRALRSIGESYGLDLKYDDTVKDVTEELITKLAGHEENVYKKVVILVDEYDSPILSVFNVTEESMTIASENHEILKSFFEMIKALQGNIKFLLVTGVTMFAQLGLFSGANNLDDVTLGYELSGAYGFTEDEIMQTFESSLSKYNRYSIEDLQKKYNGYSWDCKFKVYNPYSICMFFNKFELENHWIQKGKTSFLAKLIDAKHVKNIVGEITIKKKSIVPVNIKEIQKSSKTPVSLLFQTGYLTIKRKELDEDEDVSLVLEIPNTEVKESLMSELWANLDNISIEIACSRIQKLAKLLKEDKFIEFMREFNDDLASIPYNESQCAGNYEGYYHSHVHMLVRYIGLPFRSEDATSQGRTDMWVMTNTVVYYIEYKRHDPQKTKNDQQTIKNLIQEAIEQIFVKEYYVSTGSCTKTKFAIGCVFSTGTRKICGVGIQEFGFESGKVKKKQLKFFIEEFSSPE